MSQHSKLLFLHGVGDGDLGDNWMTALDDSLQRLGYPRLDADEVIIPKFPNALHGVDDDVPLPPVTIKLPGRETARQNRRGFERRIGAVEFSMGRPERGSGLPVLGAVVDVAIATPPFVQARRYLKDARIRAQVLTRVLQKVPASGRIVIVGHSLGSVIAADLLRRLPAGVEVTGMVSIGSPLANANFEVDKLRDALADPPTNLAWWVNFWNGADPVVASRGLSSVFPWLLDYRIQTQKFLGLQAHFAVDYLSNDAVATAIGYAVFGSRSRELISVDRGVDVPLDTAETFTLLALRYAHHIKLHLEKDQRQRFEGALRSVQATAIEELRLQRHASGRPLPSAVAGLAFDVSDSASLVPEPLPMHTVAKDVAVIVLTVLAAQNVIRPFEIAISTDHRQEAIKDLAAEMGLGSQFGEDVFAALKQAQNVVRGTVHVNWIKWSAIAVGAIAIVVATGGLALAAGGGLVGAAAITSALATFGPGGMIGGLLTAGALATAGGSGIAFGLASQDTTAEALEVVVVGQLATAILRKKQRLEQDPAVWRTLAETEVAVRREYERLDEFSDDKAAGLKELERKIMAVGRALDYLRQNGMEPGSANDERDG